MATTTGRPQSLAFYSLYLVNCMFVIPLLTSVSLSSTYVDVVVCVRACVACFFAACIWYFYVTLLLAVCRFGSTCVIAFLCFALFEASGVGSEGFGACDCVRTPRLRISGVRTIHDMYPVVLVGLPGQGAYRIFRDLTKSSHSLNPKLATDPDLHSTEGRRGWRVSFS